ncbi:hypothetical protein ACPC54_17800 [Kitasatospora sp. NPDC094028]
MAVFVVLASLAGFALLLWLDWRARRRVRSVRVAEVSPEAVRYVSRRREGNR